VLICVANSDTTVTLVNEDYCGIFGHFVQRRTSMQTGLIPGPYTTVSITLSASFILQSCLLLVETSCHHLRPRPPSLPPAQKYRHNNELVSIMSSADIGNGYRRLGLPLLSLSVSLCFANL